jgi:hypothetical protein
MGDSRRSYPGQQLDRLGHVAAGDRPVASEAATRGVTFDRDERRDQAQASPSVRWAAPLDRGVQHRLVHVGEPALEHRIVQAAGRGGHLPRARPGDRHPGLLQRGDQRGRLARPVHDHRAGRVDRHQGGTWSTTQETPSCSGRTTSHSIPAAANLIFQLVSARYERASMIVTSNRPLVAQLGSAAVTIAEALVRSPSEFLASMLQAVSYAAVGGPNQVASASGSPRWVPSPTQAT